VLIFDKVRGVGMPPSSVIHSIDLSLDRTDQTLLTDSLNGIILKAVF